MGNAFERLAKSVLNHLGQDALLTRAGSGEQLTCRVNVERGVQMMGLNEDATFPRDILTIDSKVDARSGDRVDHPRGTFVLDGLLSDNGFTQRFTVQLMTWQ